MKIETLKDLEAIIKLCKKHGVEDIAVDGIQLKLDITHAAEKKRSTDSTDDSIQTDGIDEDAALFWSSAPIGPLNG